MGAFPRSMPPLDMTRNARARGSPSAPVKTQSRSESEGSINSALITAVGAAQDDLGRSVGSRRRTGC
jgi:hypothetical protein